MNELASLAKEVESVKSYDEKSLVLHATIDAVNAFKGLKIFFGRKDFRFKKGDTIVFPTNVSVEPYSCFPVGSTLVSMGAFSYSESELPAGTEVGRYCSIAKGLHVFRDRHPIEWVTTSSVTYDFKSKNGYRSFVEAQTDFNGDTFPRSEPPNKMGRAPRICDDVWIGQNVQLARDIVIGTGSVVAAGAVVTKDVAPYSIVGGVPAKVLKGRFPQEIIDGLIDSEWWRYDPSIFADCDYRDPQSFISQIGEIKSKVAYSPNPITAADVIRALANS